MHRKHNQHEQQREHVAPRDAPERLRHVRESACEGERESVREIVRESVTVKACVRACA